MRLMRVRRACGGALSRRSLLALFPAAVLAQTSAGDSEKGRLLSPDWGRYPDPSTEFEVLRLTSPDYDTFLPPPPARTVTRRSSDVLVASRRTGTLQAHLLDADKGGSRVLTAVQSLDPVSLTLAPDDRSFYFFDGGELKTAALSNLRELTLCHARDGWQRTGSLAVSEDNLALYFTESSPSESALRRVVRARGAVDTLLSSPGAILDATPNPRRAMILWRTAAGRASVATLAGQGIRLLETPPGQVLQAMWSPDGQSVLYLLQPADATQLIQIREQEVDSRADRLVAKTSQFVAFQRNANGSVYVGASRNKAAPCVLVLLRSTRREFTLCEHKSGSPAAAAPVFSPNSQWIFFQSDRDGKPAIYTMKVEKLLEKTDT